ncbi:MAG: DUF2723 domain-containing protein [Gemmatimonadota bacterium]|nr:DUF2723 domain-containing protein [Gemmatimonadota bacterium]
MSDNHSAGVSKTPPLAWGALGWDALGWGALAAGCIFLLYLVTLAPTTALWDASEYIAAARVLGLPHPPGNPLFVLMAHAFGSLPLPLAYAARINVLAALSSSVAAGVWFVLIDDILLQAGTSTARRRICASAGVLIGASAFTVWNQSVVNEKVYTISLALFGVITLLLLQWLRSEPSRRNDMRLVVIALLLGAGYCVHPAGLLPGPAVVMAVAYRDWRRFLQPRLVALVAGAFVLGLTPFVFEPIRAAQQPALNEGAPTGCEHGIGWSCTFSEKTWQRLEDNINRTQYAKPSVMDRQIGFAPQLGMWWLYFKWQWLRDVHGVRPQAQLMLALVVLGLGLYGGYAHWRFDRPSFAYWAPFMFTITVLLVYYMNFKYGFSQAQELRDSVPREVRDRDYFFLWSFSAWGVWIGVGIASVWRRFNAGAGLLALAVIPFTANWSAASRRNDTVARDWGVDLLNSVEPYAVIVTIGDNDTFPLWYAQMVEGVRPDVTVIIEGYLDMDWPVHQLIQAPIRTYDPAKGPPVFRDRKWMRPTRPALNMTLAESDSVPDYTEIREPQIFRSAAVEGRVQPGYLERKDIFVLRLITDAMPQRPIYFTAGSSYPARFGLQRYMRTEGLVQHLMPSAVGDSSGESLDLARSAALWQQYHGPAAIVRRGDWVDRASLVVPVDYALLGIRLSAALDSAGRHDEAKSVRDQAVSVIRGARMEELFGLPPA